MSGSDTVFVLQRYGGTGAFSPTTICTITIPPGDNEATETTLSVPTISSGDKIRLKFEDIGSGAGGYTVQLTGAET